MTENAGDLIKGGIGLFLLAAILFVVLIVVLTLAFAGLAIVGFVLLLCLGIALVLVPAFIGYCWFELIRSQYEVPNDAAWISIVIGVVCFFLTLTIRLGEGSSRLFSLWLALPRGLLLFGPPGTGKTFFAKALAKETHWPFINMKTENMFTRWLGESGQRVRNAIRLAEQAAPALVFIDEIDRFGQRGSSQGDSAAQETQRTFAQMLEWLGDTNRKTCIVGTTNIPGNLDKAFLRAGRFSYRIPFLYPDKTARLQILRMHLGLEGSRQKPEMDEKSVLAVIRDRLRG